MGRAQEVMRHGCGRIVEASGLCIPCIERTRTAVPLDDAMLTPRAKASTRADGLPEPYEGQCVAGFHVTQVSAGMSCAIVCPIVVGLLIDELVVMAAWPEGHSPRAAPPLLAIEDFQIGTRSYNVSRGPVPCSTAPDGHRWKFPRTSDMAHAWARATPSVPPILRVKNVSAETLVVRAAVYGSESGRYG